MRSRIQSFRTDRPSRHWNDDIGSRGFYRIQSDSSVRQFCFCAFLYMEAWLGMELVCARSQPRKRDQSSAMDEKLL